MRQDGSTTPLMRLRLDPYEYRQRFPRLKRSFIGKRSACIARRNVSLLGCL